MTGNDVPQGLTSAARPDPVSLDVAPTIQFSSPDDRLSAGLAEGPTGRAWRVGSGLASLSFCLTLAALFPAYFAGEPSLASSTPQLAYNLPFLVAAAAVAVSLAVPRLRRVGVGLTLGLALFSAPVYVRAFSDLPGPHKAGAGFVLGEVGFGFLLAAFAVVLRSARASGLLVLQLRRSGAFWALLGAALGAAYAAGDAMNWIRREERITVGDSVFRATGTAFYRFDCCSLSHRSGWDLGTELALLALAVAVPVVAACWRVEAVGVGLLSAGSLVLLASPLVAVVRVSQSATPESFGITSSVASATGLVVSRSGLPGLWLAVGAASAMLAVALLRALLLRRRPTGGRM